MLEKPPHGDPCNGCGLCCQDTCCPLAMVVFQQKDGPCPALELDGEGFACGMIKNPRRYAPVRTAIAGAAKLSKAAAFLIGAGLGCDAQLEDEPANEAFRLTMRKKTLADMSRVAECFIAWGITRETARLLYDK